MHKTEWTKIFGRITSGGSNVIVEVDGLRFLAIFSVIIFHLRTSLLRTSPIHLINSEWSLPIFNFISTGNFGVNVFFGISGFILALPFFNSYRLKGKEISLKNYYMRRLTRLEPPYIILMLSFFLIILFFIHQPISYLLPHLCASLSYTHFLIYGSWSTINPVTWSLETEVQFYLLAPVIFLIFKIKKTGVRVGFIILLLTAFCFFQFTFSEFFYTFHLQKSLLFYLPYFLTGVLFADFYLIYLQYNHKSKSYLWDLLGIIATYIMFKLNILAQLSFNLIGIFSLFIVFISTFRGKLLNYFYTRKIIYIIGGMCYTIYLVHYIFIFYIMQFTVKIVIGHNFIINLFIQAILVLPLLLIVCSMIFVLFEKPFMDKNWPSKIISFFKTVSKV